MKNSISKLVSDNGSALSEKSGAPAGIEKDSMVRSADSSANRTSSYNAKVQGSKACPDAPGPAGLETREIVAPLAAAPTAANTAEEVARAEIHDTVQKIIDIIPASAFLTGEGNKIGKDIEDIIIAMHAKKNYNFCTKESILDQLESALDDAKAKCLRPFFETRRIKITLKHAAKWIKMNSFSSLPADTRKRTNNLPDGGGKKGTVSRAKPKGSKRGFPLKNFRVVK